MSVQDVSPENEESMNGSWRTNTALLLLPCLCPLDNGLGQTLSINFRGTTLLDSSASDQNGRPFTVTGLSGIDYAGGGLFLAVLDNSDKLVSIAVTLNSDGSIASAPITGGLTLSESRDFEGIAFTTPQRNSVFLSEENTPQVREYALSSYELLQALDTPPVFFNRRENRGFESLSRRADGSELWTANEEALTSDGSESTPMNGTVVRLLRYELNDNAATAAEQYAYVTEPMHGGQIRGSLSGLVDLVVLPNGKMLALERSLAFGATLFQNRLYEIDFAGATDVSVFDNGLIGETYTPVAKHLLWLGDVGNLEGLTLGPQLVSGNHSLLGVVDDGDPISMNLLVAFELIGDVGGCEPCDMNCDGAINAFDIEPLLDLLFDGGVPCDTCTGDANGDGNVDAFDIEPFLECLFP